MARTPPPTTPYCYVEYNGVRLNVVHVDRWERSNEYDESRTDRLATKHVLSVLATLSPEAASYETGAGGQLVEKSGILATDTDIAIRDRMLTPRKKLRFVMGKHDDGSEIVALESPAPNMAMDTNNGPSPLECSIVQFYGSRTWMVRFTVETRLSGCPDEVKGVPVYSSAILSNRWTQGHSFDEDRFTTISTRGVALLRTDVMAKLNLTGFADYFRDVVLPPPPASFFKRARVNITATPSGNALHYEVIDREMPYDLGSRSVLGSTASFFGVESVQARQSYANVEDENGGVASPMAMSTLEVTAVGSRESRRSMLTQFCLSMLLERLPMPIPGEDLQGGHGILRRISISEELTGRTVSLSATVMYPPLGGVAGPGQVLPNVPGNIMPAQIPGSSLSPQIRSDLFERDFILLFNNASQSPQPPKDQATRGPYDGYIVTQAITSACEAKITPANTRIPLAGGQGGFLGGAPTVVTSATAAVFPFNSRARFFNNTHLGGKPWTHYRAKREVRNKSGAVPAQPTGNAPTYITPPPWLYGMRGATGQANPAPVQYNPMVKFKSDAVEMHIWVTAERAGAKPLPPPAPPSAPLIPSVPDPNLPPPPSNSQAPPSVNANPVLVGSGSRDSNPVVPPHGPRIFQSEHWWTFHLPINPFVNPFSPLSPSLGSSKTAVVPSWFADWMDQLGIGSTEDVPVDENGDPAGVPANPYSAPGLIPPGLMPF